MRFYVKRNIFGGWSLRCATKYGNVDEKCYIRVKFVNCEEPKEDEALIEEKGARFGAYKKKVSEGVFVGYPTLTIFDYQLATAKFEKDKDTDINTSELEWY